jgi:ABC-type glycerol-3-phosphate transport system substrate-binding protein
MRYLRSRRSVIAAAAAVALALAVSACGGSPAAASGHITLTVWSYFGGDQLAALKAQDVLFEKAHPNVTVQEVVVPGAQLDPKLLAGASTHTGPDVFLDNVVVDFPELTAAGVLANLTKDWDSYPDKAQFPAAGIWRTSNGQIYNVMSYSNLLGLFYNKTILDQYHLTPPTTISQFESDMKVVTKAGKYTALAASDSPDVGGAWTWFPLLLEQGTNYCNMTAANAAPMFSTVASWAKAGYLPKEAATWEAADAWTAFMTGNYAFGINGNWNLGVAKSATFSLGTTQFPAGPDGSRVFPGGEGLGIGAFSKYKQLDWEYLETAWLSSKASVLDFSVSGQIPTRADAAGTPTVKDDTAATPFVDATKTVSAWPRSPETAQMQGTVGTELSDVVSGQATPAQAAATTAAQIKADIKAGGGGC